MQTSRTRQAVGKRCGIIGTSLGLLALAACSTTADINQTDALAKAAAAFKMISVATSPVVSSGAAAERAELVSKLVQGAPDPLYDGCDKATEKARDEIIRASTPAEETRAFRSFQRVRLCGTVAPYTKTSVDDPSLTTWGALNSYFDGLQAIVAAKDANEVSNATQKVSKSLQDLASAAKTPIPATLPAFADRVVVTILEQEKYRELQRAVLSADPLFDAAAPSLTRALRLRQSLWASEIAQDSATSMALINSALASPAANANPDIRLQTYDRAAPIIDALNQQMQASLQNDPAETIQALLKAHHALAYDLKSNRGQPQAIFGAVIDLASGVETLASGASARSASK